MESGGVALDLNEVIRARVARCRSESRPPPLRRTPMGPQRYFTRSVTPPTDLAGTHAGPVSHRQPWPPSSGAGAPPNQNYRIPSVSSRPTLKNPVHDQG